MPAPNYKSVEEIFSSVKQSLIDKNLSIEEVSENCKIDEELLTLLLSSDVIDQISRVFEFTGHKMLLRLKEFKTHKLYYDDDKIKITRIIRPKASIYYDKKSGKFFGLKINKSDESRKELIVSEMQEILKNNLHNSL